MPEGRNPFAEGEPPDAFGPRAGAAREALPAGDPPPRSRRAPTRLTLLAAVAAVAAVIAVIVNTAGGSGPSNPIRLASLVPLPQSPLPGSRPFTTATPAQWHVSMTFPYTGVTDYQLSNSQSWAQSGAVLPPPGSIEIQIQDFSPASVTSSLGPRAAGQNPLQLLGYEFEPRGARDVVRAVAPHRVSLGGVAAATEAYTYIYAGRRDIQTELVSRKAGEIVSIEMDSAPALRASAASALSSIVAHLQWLSPSQQARNVAPQPRPVSVPPTGPLPRGQWIASGFTDVVQGDVANARLDERNVRAWYFTRVCTTAKHCHTELFDQLMNGSTARAAVAQIPGNSWWEARFPATAALCARLVDRPTRRETIRDTLRFAWLTPAHRELLADEDETINGCGDAAPAQVSSHWTARVVPRPPTPQLTLNASHASSASAFRNAARRVFTSVNAQASRLALRIAAAAHVVRTATSRVAKAAAEASIAKQLAPILPLSVEIYTRIPQPPAGPLDALWRRDIDENRQQLLPAAAAISALQAAVLASSRFIRTASPLAMQTAVTEGTLYAEDQAQGEGAAAASEAIERELRLPAICVDPPAFHSLFAAPVITLRRAIAARPASTATRRDRACAPATSFALWNDRARSGK